VHHVKQLVRLECAELVRKEKVNGGTRHIYRATHLALVSTDEWDHLHPEEAQAFVAEITQKILDDVLASQKAEIIGFDSDFYLTRTPLQLDLEGLREGIQLLERADNELGEIMASSQHRRQEVEDAETFPVSRAFALFKMPADSTVPTQVRTRPETPQRGEAVGNRLKAMSQPVRREVLRSLVEGDASPSEIGRRLDLPTPNIAHHVKQLVKLECAVLVAEKKVRGSIQHIYRATVPALVSTDEWDHLHPADAQAFVTEIMKKIHDDFLISEKAEIVGLDSDFYLTRTPSRCDLEGLRNGIRLMECVSEEMSEVAGRSQSRQRETCIEGLPVSCSLALFKVPPG
jgi:DNA-binding transcriptional ArsR family regulator